MNSVEAQERSAEFLDMARSLFWFERLLLSVMLLFSSNGVSLFIGPLLFSTTFCALLLHWLCRKNSSADRSVSISYIHIVSLPLIRVKYLSLSFCFVSYQGVTTSRIWLFLSDRFVFLAALGDYKAVWLFRLTVIIAVAVHYVYIIQYLDISYKTHLAGNYNLSILT